MINNKCYNNKIYFPKIGELIEITNLATETSCIDIVTKINYFKRPKKKDLPISFQIASSKKRILVKNYTLVIERI
tara:strand:- start:657 stop:881 length:225 start_codon:yes stop_codon:yes gene_type:complete